MEQSPDGEVESARGPERRCSPNTHSVPTGMDTSGLLPITRVQALPVVTAPHRNETACKDFVWNPVTYTHDVFSPIPLLSLSPLQVVKKVYYSTKNKPLEFACLLKAETFADLKRMWQLEKDVAHNLMIRDHERLQQEKEKAFLEAQAARRAEEKRLAKEAAKAAKNAEREAAAAAAAAAGEEVEEVCKRGCSSRLTKGTGRLSFQSTSPLVVHLPLPRHPCPPFASVVQTRYAPCQTLGYEFSS